MDMRDSTVFGPMPSVSLPDRSSWKSGNDLAVIAVAGNHRAVREEMLTRDSDIRAGVVRFSAAAAHHEGMREWLESKNFKVPEYSDGERLIDAAEREGLPQIRRPLAAGADVNHRGESDWTPFTKAATWGCPKAVKLLLENNAHPNTLKHQPSRASPRTTRGSIFGSDKPEEGASQSVIDVEREAKESGCWQVKPEVAALLREAAAKEAAGVRGRQL